MSDTHTSFNFGYAFTFCNILFTHEGWCFFQAEIKGKDTRHPSRGFSLWRRAVCSRKHSGRRSVWLSSCSHPAAAAAAAAGARAGGGALHTAARSF